jgi:hypothetical protein
MKTVFSIVIVFILTSIGINSHRTCYKHVDTVIRQTDSMLIHNEELIDSLNKEMRDITHKSKKAHIPMRLKR